MFDIKPVNSHLHSAIQARIDNKTKPAGALGQLEMLALQLASIVGFESIDISQPTILVFAGDHGIAKSGVSIAPPEVTQQMVLNFLNGGAAINCFCRANQTDLEVIDAGILTSVEHPELTLQSLGRGTNNFSEQAAMSLASVDKGISLGARVVYRHVAAGTNCFGFGEMGIGNTSSASALMAALTDIDLSDCVGRGTGIDDQVLNKKRALIEGALKQHQINVDDPKAALAAVGGFEIVQMVGAMLAAAESESVLLIDGFIATVAALIATRLAPESRDYMIFCHQSKEKGHQHLLRILEATPLLDLDMRLGEGTGAALAVPLIRAAASFYNDMASFADAGIEAV